jgi:Ca2+-binding RTX toxin-like protein
VADAIHEDDDGGTDTILATSTYSIESKGNIENLFLAGEGWINGNGNDRDNRILGNAGSNVLDGKGGADTLEGGSGSDTYFVDSAGDIVVEAGDDTFDLVISTVSFALGAALELLYLWGNADSDGTGNDSDNVIDGNEGNNVIDGGGGADTMYGRSGDDVFVVDDKGDMIADPDASGNDTVKSAISYSLAGSSLDALILTGAAAINGTGNEFDNVLHGNIVGNRLAGGKGSDSIYGEGGNDTLVGEHGDDRYFIDGSADVVIESANSGIDTVVSENSYVLAANIENLELSGTAGASATGNTLANKLLGTSGGDSLDGKLGADTMKGGAGNDTYVVDNAKDIVDENGGNGTDKVQSTISYVLGLGLEQRRCWAAVP